jgi:hypothetical protein
MMKTAVNELYRVSADEKVRQQYEAREKAWKDDMARTAYAKKKGLAEGMKIGEARAAAQYQARIAEAQQRIVELERQLLGQK